MNVTQTVGRVGLSLIGVSGIALIVFGSRSIKLSQFNEYLSLEISGGVLAASLIMLLVLNLLEERDKKQDAKIAAMMQKESSSKPKEDPKYGVKDFHPPQGETKGSRSSLNDLIR